MSDFVKVLGFDDSAIDKKTGAPLAVRNAVGGAPNPKDRLATLRQYYADAQPYDNDNFVFTDPTTNKITLYNPDKRFMNVPIPDPGDLASITPEIMEMAGGAAGLATVLNPATMISTGGASVLTAPLAYGLGAAGGREFENLVATQLTERKDTREPHERLIDTALTTTANATFQKYGEALQNTLSNFVGKARDATSANLADFRKHKIEPMLSAVHSKPLIHNLEQAFSDMMLSGPIIINQAKRTVNQIGQAIDNMAAVHGDAAEAVSAGTAIRFGANEWRKSFMETSEKLYDRADQFLIGKRGDGFVLDLDEPISLERTLAAMYDTVTTFKSNPELGKSLTGGSLLDMGHLIETGLTRAQAAKGELAPPDFIPNHLGSFKEIKKLRTIIGESLSNPQVNESFSRQQMKRVYAALSEDMEAYAKTKGPEALKAFRRANDHFRAGMDRQDKIASALDQKFSETPSALYKIIIDSSKRGAARESESTLNAYKRSVPKERWDSVVTTIVRQLGEKTPGTRLPDEVFSVNTFLTNLHKMSPTAKDIIFGGTRYKDLRAGLDEIYRISGNMKEAGGYKNTSNTAKSLGVMLTFGMLTGGGPTMILGGSTAAGGMGAAASAAIYGLGQIGIAKLITNPRFIKALSEGGRVNFRNERSIGQWLSKIGGVAIVEPHIREEIQLFLEGFRPTFERIKTDTPFATQQQEQQ